MRQQFCAWRMLTNMLRARTTKDTKVHEGKHDRGFLRDLSGFGFYVGL